MPSPGRRGAAPPATAIDGPGPPAYHGGMKHLPEAHQSIAPDRSVTLVLAGIVVVMAIIWLVVSLAD